MCSSERIGFKFRTEKKKGVTEYPFYIPSPALNSPATPRIVRRRRGKVTVIKH